MKDKNTIIGFALIALVIIGFTWFSQPSQEEQRAQQVQDSLAQVKAKLAEAEKVKVKKQKKTQKTEVVDQDSTALFAACRKGKAQNIVLKNDSVRLTLSTLGGMVQQAQMVGHRNYREENVTILTPENATMEFTFEGKNDNYVTSDYYFEPVDQTDSTVTMRLQDASGARLDLVYTLHPGSYMVDLIVRSQGLGKYFSPKTKVMNIDWWDRARQQEKGYDFENRYSSLTYKFKNGGTDNLSETKEDDEDAEKPLDWVAFKNQFFSCVLIAHQDFTQAHLETKPMEKESGYLKEYSAQLQTPFDPTGKQETQLQLYLGPNNYHLLQQTNELSLSDKELDLEELVYLGWWLFRWINRFTILYIFDWLAALGMPMGIVLLLLTIIVKLAVYPATRKSYLSSAKMRVLKPKIDELAAKYPNQEDAMKKQQETMQLYSQYGVSPMGGCLPMLIQMPIWIALFNFVPNAIQLRGQSFLWADDLSSYDALIHWNKDIWLIGDHLSLFCLLFTVTNIINTFISMRQQQNQMMSSEQAQQMKMMQYMMYVMPLMFFFMFNNYSSGLCYYYFLSGLTSVLIMWFLRKTTNDKKLLAKLEAYRAKHKNDPKKMSGLAARLEKLQQMQEQQMKMQQQHKR